MTTFDQALVLNKYCVQYYRCDRCGFIQTEAPYWLDEAYSEAITASDIGLVNRNIALASVTQTTILALFDQRAKFVDYGGGYGLLVRMLRDTGFDFYRFDKYCDNLFARGFDADVADVRSYELATAYEVFEHLVNPLDDIAKMLRLAPSILFSTRLAPEPAPRLGNWWYYGTEHGQHVALYTYRSLEALARRFHLNLYSDRQSLHLLTPKRLSSLLFRLATRYPIAMPVNFLLLASRRSLLPDDYRRRTGKQLR